MRVREHETVGSYRAWLGALGLAAGLCAGGSGAWAQAGPNTRPQTGAVSPSGTETTNAERTIPGNQAAQAGSQLTPSATDFVNAASDNANWILPAKSYTGNHYTGATQVTPDNVGGLTLAWKFQMDDDGPVENSPIVWNGTMYVTSAHDHVYALDAATGKLKWEFTDNPHVIAFAANRGIALFDGNVYIGTLDGHLIALNAENGQKVWDIQAVDDPANSFFTMAPVPYHDPNTNQDMLLLGVSNGDWGGVGHMTAFDPKDGHRIWRWTSIPSPGEPGHDSWSGDSWKRGCGAMWGGATIDTDAHTLYLNVGNPCPDFLGYRAPGRQSLHGFDGGARHLGVAAEVEMAPPVHPARYP